MAQYLDFDIEIGNGSGRDYPLVIRSPAGEARERMRFPFDAIELQNQLLTLENALLRSAGGRRAVTAEEQTVQRFGAALFDALMVGQVRDVYGQSLRQALANEHAGLRLKLRILPPELAALPWEYLYDPRRPEFVCMSRQTSIVRYLELAHPPAPLRVRPPLRILAMIASPHGFEPLSVDRERERIERAVADLRAHGLVELHWVAGQTWRDLQRALRRGAWNMFHFIGHGGYDPNADEG